MFYVIFTGSVVLGGGRGAEPAEALQRGGHGAGRAAAAFPAAAAGRGDHGEVSVEERAAHRARERASRAAGQAEATAAARAGGGERHDVLWAEPGQGPSGGRAEREPEAAHRGAVGAGEGADRRRGRGRRAGRGGLRRDAQVLDVVRAPGAAAAAARVALAEEAAHQAARGTAGDGRRYRGGQRERLGKQKFQIFPFLVF